MFMKHIRFPLQNAAHTPDSVSAKTMSPTLTISMILDRRRKNDSFKVAPFGSCVSCACASSKEPNRSLTHRRLNALPDDPPVSRART
jgi:hypothetical protein